MMNQTKFGLPHLDTPNSRYNSVILLQNKENKNQNLARELQLGAPGLYAHGDGQRGP